MTDSDPTRKSKSQRKREAHALQTLGESLIALGASERRLFRFLRDRAPDAPNNPDPPNDPDLD